MGTTPGTRSPADLPARNVPGPQLRSHLPNVAVPAPEAGSKVTHLNHWHHVQASGAWHNLNFKKAEGMTVTSFSSLTPSVTPNAGPQEKLAQLA